MLMWIKLKSSVFQVLRVALHYTNATCQWFFSKTHALRGLLVKPVNVLSRSSSFLSSFLFMKNGLNFHPSPCISSTFWSHNLTAVLFFLLLRGEARVLDRGQCCASELYGPVPSLGCHCRDLGRNGVCPHHSSALLVPSKLPVFVTRLLFLAQRRELSRRIWGNASHPFQSQPQRGHLQPAIKKHPLMAVICHCKGFPPLTGDLQNVACAVMMGLM